MNQQGLRGLREIDDKRLKILHIAGWYPSKKNPVAGVFVREHVKATALYNDVTVLYSEGVAGEIRGFYQIEDNIEDGIRTLRLRHRKSPIPRTGYFIYLWGMFCAFRKLIGEGFRPDVIHAHVYSAGVAGVLMGKRYGIPVIVTEHFTGFPRGLVRGLEKVKAKFAFERADLVCPVSEDLKRHIEDYGIRARFCVVPNVVDTALFAPRDFAPTREDNRKHLLLVALLDPKKGVPYLLKALACLRKKREDFILDIVGDGPNRAEYREMADSLGLADSVRFHGLKTKVEIAELMRQSNFFVLPSIWENLPCVLIEAMASGLPIVATKVGGIPEILTDEVGELVPPANPEALAAAIEHMLDHCRDYVPERIVQYAEGRYSYQAVGSKLNKLYRSVLRQRS